MHNIKLFPRPRAKGMFPPPGHSLGAPVHKNFAIILQAIVYNRYAVLSNPETDNYDFDGEYVEVRVNNKVLNFSIGRLEAGMGGLGSIIESYQIYKELPAMVITSNVYTIDTEANVLFTGFNQLSLANISINNPYTFDYSNQKIRIKYENEIIKELDVIIVTLNNYILNNNNIVINDETFNFNNLNILTGNRFQAYKGTLPNVSNIEYVLAKVENNNLVIEMGRRFDEINDSGVLASYPIISTYVVQPEYISSNRYTVDDISSFVYTGFQRFEQSYITSYGNYRAMQYWGHNILNIYDDENYQHVAKQYDIISLSLENYLYQNNSILYTGEFDINNIDVVTSENYKVFKGSVPGNYVGKYILIKIQDNNLIVKTGYQNGNEGEEVTIDVIPVVNDSSVSDTYIELVSIKNNEEVITEVFNETEDTIEFLVRNATAESVKALFKGNNLNNNYRYEIDEIESRTASGGSSGDYYDAYGNVFNTTGVTYTNSANNWIAQDTYVPEDYVKLGSLRYSNNNYQYFNVILPIRYNNKNYKYVIIRYYDPTPAIEALNNMDNTSNNNGEYHIIINSRDFDDINEAIKVTEDNLYNFCWQDENGNYQCGQLPNESLDDPEVKQRIINEKNKDRIASLAWNIIDTQLIESFESDGYFVQSNIIDNDNKTLSVVVYKGNQYSSDYHYVYDRIYTYSVTNNIDAEVAAAVDAISANIKTEYLIEGKEYLNALYHYGGINDIWDGATRDGSKSLFIWKEFKKNADVYKTVGLEYKVIAEGDIMSPESGGCAMNLYIVKDGITYSYNFFDLRYSSVFYLDKNKSGTPEKKMKDILNSYFKGEAYNLTTQYYGPYNLDGKNYDSYLFTLTFGDRGPYYLVGILAPSTYVNSDYLAEAYDAETDISINSTGYEVPVDVELDITDKKNDKNIQSLLAKYSYEMVDAYNIVLYGNKNDKHVNTIQDGVEVFIPTNKYNVGDVITIRHIKDDGTLGEMLQGTVVSRNNKLYAKFTTTHFSTYALVNEVLTASEDSVNLETLYTNATDPVEKTITITNNGENSLSLEASVPTDNGPFAVLLEKTTLAPGESTTVKILTDLNSAYSTLDGDYSGTYVITATDSVANETYELEIPVSVGVRTHHTSIEYTTHVQYIGWQKYVSDGAMAGTSGKAYRLEGIKIRLADQEYEGNIEYRTVLWLELVVKHIVLKV